MKDTWKIPLLLSIIFSLWGVIDELNGIKCSDQLIMCVLFGLYSIQVALEDRPKL